jgi:hypothetical protein
MSENRSNRELNTRETTARKRAWVRPQTLPDPIPQEGYTYHWVRISTRGEADAMNISSKFLEGWEPVKALDHPEIFTTNVDDPRFKENIVIGGLLLCKIPSEMAQQRNKFYSDQADAQIRSVDNNLMRENDPRMPLFNERKSNVTFGRGS